MLGKTHIPFGVTTALLVTRPSTVPGVIAMTIAIGIFIGAYKLGTKLTDIKG